MNGIRSVALIMLCVVGVSAVVAITLVSVRASDQERTKQRMRNDDPRAFVDDSIARGTSWKVSCATMDGGTDVDVLVNVDGGANMGPVTDYTLSSTSATCVRVGFDSTVDQNHGTPVGLGCAGGTVWPMHAKGGRCQSTAAAVVVDVTGGKP